MRLFFGLFRFVTARTPDRWLLVGAILLDVAMRASLSVASLQTVWRCLDRAGLLRIRNSSRPSDISLEQVSRAMTRAAYWTPGVTCLARALAGAVLLSRFGYRSTLCIGVMKAEGEFGAHAWLESDGPAVVNRRGDFTTLLVMRM